MNNIIKILIVLMLVIFLIPGDTAQMKLNIVGSTSVQPICEELIEEYKKSHDDVDINVQGGGSSLGIKCANQSVADIGMSSKQFDCENLVEHELGSEAIVVIVNKNNPINELSSSQLQKVFSGEIKQWNELTNKSGRINVIVREEGSGTLDAFKDIIMKNTEIKQNAVVQNSAGSIKQSVIRDENAIGFVSLSHIDNQLKNLSVDGVFADKKSILDKSYKLQRPFILLTDKNPNNQTSQFIQWIKSSEAQRILELEKIF